MLYDKGVDKPFYVCLGCNEYFSDFELYLNHIHKDLEQQGIEESKEKGDEESRTERDRIW